MFANIGDLTSNVISSEKNLPLQFLNLKMLGKYSASSTSLCQIFQSNSMQMNQIL